MNPAAERLLSDADRLSLIADALDTVADYMDSKGMNPDQATLLDVSDFVLADAMNLNMNAGAYTLLKEVWNVAD